MDITLQKIALSIMCLTVFSVSTFTSAAPIQPCSQAPILVAQKQVGQASYFAESCKQSWDSQNIQMRFAYSQDIPEWAFKRATTNFLKKKNTRK